MGVAGDVLYTFHILVYFPKYFNIRIDTFNILHYQTLHLHNRIMLCYQFKKLKTKDLFYLRLNARHLVCHIKFINSFTEEPSKVEVV